MSRTCFAPLQGWRSSQRIACPAPRCHNLPSFATLVSESPLEPTTKEFNNECDAASALQFSVIRACTRTQWCTVQGIPAQDCARPCWDCQLLPHKNYPDTNKILNKDFRLQRRETPTLSLSWTSSLTTAWSHSLQRAARWSASWRNKKAWRRIIRVLDIKEMRDLRERVDQLMQES